MPTLPQTEPRGAAPKPAAGALPRLAKVSAHKAADVCRFFDLEEPSKILLTTDIAPRAFFDLLVAKEYFHDAIRFLAYAVPKPEAVWWSCRCARQALGTNPAPKLAAALDAAEKWVREPSDDNRRATFPAGQAADFGTPAGSTALAAFLSGGSMGPTNVGDIPPLEDLTAKVVTCAVMLSAVFTQPEMAGEKFRGFLSDGIQIADGANRWK